MEKKCGSTWNAPQSRNLRRCWVPSARNGWLSGPIFALGWCSASSARLALAEPLIRACKPESPYMIPSTTSFAARRPTTEQEVALCLLSLEVSLLRNELPLPRRKAASSKLVFPAPFPPVKTLNCGPKCILAAATLRTSCTSSLRSVITFSSLELKPHRHDDVSAITVTYALNQTAAVRVGMVQFNFLTRHGRKGLKQVTRVKPNFQGGAVVINRQFFLGFFLFGIVRPYAQCPRLQLQPTAAVFLVSENRSPLDRLAQALTIHQHQLVGVMRIYPLIIWKSTVNELRCEF